MLSCYTVHFSMIRTCTSQNLPPGDAVCLAGKAVDSFMNGGHGGRKSTPFIIFILYSSYKLQKAVTNINNAD